MSTTVDPSTRRLCPHCMAPTTNSDPASATRCAVCKLVIGPGRSLEPGDGDAGRLSAAAANSLRADVYRTAADAGGDPAVAAADLRRVAERLDVAPARLRMLDYQAAWERDPSLSSLGQVIGLFGSWKAARKIAVPALQP